MLTRFWNLKLIAKKFLPHSITRFLLATNERVFLGFPNWIRFHFQQYENLPPGLQFLRDGGMRKIWDSVIEPRAEMVVIFGGYLGDSAKSWLDKFPGATIHVFEPVEEYAKAIVSRFDSHSVLVHPFGIAKLAEERTFVGGGDAASQSGLRSDSPRVGDPTERNVIFKSLSDFHELLPRGTRVEVLEINIEGGEYELVPLLSSTGFLDSVSNIFLQFHSIGEDTGEKILTVRRALETTHSLVWSYELQWDFWRKVPQAEG